MIEHTAPDTDFIDRIGLTCPNCQPILSFNPLHRQCIMEHISVHILHDCSVNWASEPCGLCLQPAPLCKIVLKKAKGKNGKISINMNTSLCPNLVDLSIKVATGCSESSPCTNHPVACPYCDKLEANPAVWSYNFQFHLLQKHPRVSLETHSNLFTLTKFEKDGMKGMWDCRYKQ